MSQQTVLPLSAAGDASFESFYPAGNETLVREIKALLRGRRSQPTLFIWGTQGCGKTHLLNACCYAAQQQNRLHFYLPISANTCGESLGRLNPQTLICIDDLQNAAGNTGLQEALLSLYERTTSGGGAVIAGSALPLGRIALGLKDLESRLTSGGIFNLCMLKDQDKQKAFKLRANRRGFKISDKVMNFIMTHYDRDMAALFALLERIDSASLAEKRKITVPFVKSIL